MKIHYYWNEIWLYFDPERITRTVWRTINLERRRLLNFLWSVTENCTVVHYLWKFAFCFLFHACMHAYIKIVPNNIRISFFRHNFGTRTMWEKHFFGLQEIPRQNWKSNSKGVIHAVLWRLRTEICTVRRILNPILGRRTYPFCTALVHAKEHIIAAFDKSPFSTLLRTFHANNQVARERENQNSR